MDVRRWLLTLSLVVAVAAGALGGILVRRMSDHVDATSGSFSLSSVGSPVSVVPPDGGLAQALTWEGSDVLWYLSASLDGTAWLNRVQLSTRKQSSWKVPFPAPATIHTFLTWQDRTLWIAANYGIGAFDTTASSWTSAITLDPQHELQDTDAFDPTSARPGTWVDGLVVEGSDVFVTRNNVPAVFRLVGEELVVQNKLAGSPAGLAILAGRAMPFAETPEGRANLSAIPGGGIPDDVLRDNGSSFRDDGACRGWVSPARGAVGFEGTAGRAGIDGLAVSWPNPVAASSDSRWLAAAVPAASLVAVFDCETGQVSRRALPETIWIKPADHIEFHGPAGMGDQPVQVTTDVRALAVSDGGAVAVVDGSGQIAVLE